MLALLYDIHGNLPALEAVLDDVAGRGVDRFLLGGDMAPFGAWPAQTVARLRELGDATWIRGNTERWLVEGVEDDHPMRGALAACREDLGDALADELGALPESARIDAEAIAWHGSPVSDMRSFAPRPDAEDDELLAGTSDRLLFFGHTHIQFRRTARDGIALVNPGSVGIPTDGDRRAAYALLGDGGAVELVRVAYDWRGAVQALRDRYGDAAWAATIAGRIEQARFDPVL